jgi:hypothetical protein
MKISINIFIVHRMRKGENFAYHHVEWLSAGVGDNISIYLPPKNTKSPLPIPSIQKFNQSFFNK